MGEASTKPSVICPDCNVSTVIPPTVAQMRLQSAPLVTKRFFVETTAKIGASVENMAKPPSEFNCQNCHSLLHVPTGAWVCQTCGATNPEDHALCCRCEQRKSEQQVLCGICRRSTTIPQTNFVNSLSTNFRAFTKTSQKIVYDLSKKAYVTCPRCEAHIVIHPQQQALNPNEVECPTCSLAVPVERPAPEEEDPTPVDAAADDGNLVFDEALVDGNYDDIPSDI
jgi:predicted Zn finger-like uncharacterized protein